MEKAKLIIMTLSTVFVLLAGGASAWMAFALPKGDANVLFFELAAVLCLAAAFWYGFNVWNLWKNKNN